MEVAVKLSDDLKKRMGTDLIKVPIGDSETMDTILMKLSRRHPKLVELVLDPTTGETNAECEILVNGRNIKNLRGIYTKLKHKDEVTISLSKLVE